MKEWAAGDLSAHFSVASEGERAHYEGSLYPLQDRILRVVGTYGDALVLTGGTALARCYFDHRYSDDIDLFYSGSHVRELARDLMSNLEEHGFDLITESDQPGFVRFFAGDGTAKVKIDVATDLPRVDAPALHDDLGVYVHTLREIGANKIVAFEDRREAKDLVDLSLLVRELGWQRMVADADAKRIPLEYDALVAALSQPIQGETLLTHSIDVDALAAFLNELGEQLSLTIQKKTDESSHRVNALAAKLLWDAPHASRHISALSRPVLERRAQALPLPERIALLAALRA